MPVAAVAVAARVLQPHVLDAGIESAAGVWAMDALSWLGTISLWRLATEMANVDAAAEGMVPVPAAADGAGDGVEQPHVLDVGIERAAGVWDIEPLDWLGVISLWRLATEMTGVNAAGGGEGESSGDEDIGLEPMYADRAAEETGAGDDSSDDEDIGLDPMYVDGAAEETGAGMLVVVPEGLDPMYVDGAAEKTGAGMLEDVPDGLEPM